MLALLGRVAAGGVEEDRLVGEPPVAVSSPADTANRLAAETIRQQQWFLDAVGDGLAAETFAVTVSFPGTVTVGSTEIVFSRELR